MEDLKPRLIPQAEAARYIGRTPKTLHNWRAKDQGPPSHKIKGRRFYLREDLDAWIDSQLEGAVAS